MPTSALFDYLLQQQNAGALAAKQRTEQLRLEQKDDADKEREFWSNHLAGDFDRRLKLVELQSKMAGTLGQSAPSGFDPKLQEAVQPNYMAGQVDKQKGDDAEALKRFQWQLQQQNHNDTLQQRGEQNLANNELRRLAIQGSADARRQAAQDRADRAAEKQDRYAELDSQKLGKDVDSYARSLPDMQTLATAVSKPDISGVGPIAGHVPDMLADVLTGGEATKVRGAAQRIMNNILLDQSGTAVNEQEMVRTLAATKLAPGRTDEEFRQGIRELLQINKNIIERRRGKYSPEARAKIDAWGGGIRPEEIPAVQDPGGGQQVSQQAPQQATSKSNSLLDEVRQHL